MKEMISKQGEGVKLFAVVELLTKDEPQNDNQLLFWYTEYLKII
jgi:hypothetical protein